MCWDLRFKFYFCWAKEKWKQQSKEKPGIRHALNKAHKMDLAKMKTGLGIRHPCINFRALPIAIRPAFSLLLSADTFLLALPNNLLIRVCICIYLCALSASICVRAAAGEHCQQQPPFLFWWCSFTNLCSPEWLWHLLEMVEMKK